MVYVKPTYEEYCKASFFAKVRYKIGVYVQILAVILFIGVMIYVIFNIEEMKTNPIDYAEKKMGVVCYHPLGGQSENYVYNGSYGNITSVKRNG